MPDIPWTIYSGIHAITAYFVSEDSATFGRKQHSLVSSRIARRDLWTLGCFGAILWTKSRVHYSILFHQEAYHESHCWGVNCILPLVSSNACMFCCFFKGLSLPALVLKRYIHVQTEQPKLIDLNHCSLIHTTVVWLDVHCCQDMGLLCDII